MNIWQHARSIARDTPSHRNRYVDFLRAGAILVVVFGHWLAAAPYVSDAGLEIVRMLGVAPWLHGLTWALQVMPVFFIVGGYANGASWDAAIRDNVASRDWLHTRLVRLVLPAVPLLLAWVVIGIAAGVSMLEPELGRNASRLALIPTWFLAVYIIVILLVPATRAAWQRYGLASFWIPVSLAVLVDAMAFGSDMHLLRWLNYAFVWIAIHQLGYLWRSHRADDPTVAAGWCLGGLAFLAFLVQVANYPVAMLTVPGAEFSNTRPPTVALVALGAAQFGLIRLLEAPLRKWLERPVPWTATIVVNGSIMTIFLWHSTVQVLMIGLAYSLGGLGLGWEPGSLSWWLTRPLWLGAMLGALIPVVGLFSGFERGARKASGRGFGAAVQAAGAVLLCLGIAMLAWGGMTSPTFPWIRTVPALVVAIGCLLVLARGSGTRRPRETRSS